MLPFTEYGSGKTSLILMPFLGGTQLEWTESVDTLGKHNRCITVDLPGFGDAASIPGYTVSDMSDSVVELLAALHLERYVLVGHSMAGKVAAVVTRRLLDDRSQVHAPTALVLVAPSPLAPEPMTDAKRTTLLKTISTTGTIDPEAARAYIKSNISCPVPEEVLARTVQGVLRSNPAAWTAWIESGSKEDWAQQVGMLDLPALIIAAADDDTLGPAVQQKLTEPHLPRAHQITVECSHLVPIEQPEETSALISNFLKAL